ncbi:MAG: hypothetical protein IJH91_02770 [Mogibacterium sp.]|nr:hypothetical protein [Mogibacterium sp.]
MDIDEKTEDLTGADETTGSLDVGGDVVKPMTEPVTQGAAEAFPTSTATAGPTRKPLNKKLLIGIAAVAVVLIGILLFSKGGISSELRLIQGKYELYQIVSKGSLIDPARISATGTFSVDGEKFKLYLSLGVDADGTITFKEKKTASSGETFYLYELHGSGGSGGSVLIAYSADSKEVFLFTGTSIDADNCFWFKKV